jgi:hypothetical protein
MFGPGGVRAPVARVPSMGQWRGLPTPRRFKEHRPSFLSSVSRRQYHLARATVALFNEDVGFVARPLPDNASIAFDPDDLLVKSHILIDVLWEDKLILMFASDLKSFAVPE